MLSSYEYSIYANTITAHESQQPPQPIHHKETKILFRDFGIQGVEIPTYNHLYQLLAWRKRVIDIFLDDWQNYVSGRKKLIVNPISNTTISYYEKPHGIIQGRNRKVTIEQFESYYKRIAEAQYHISVKKAVAVELSVSINTINLLIREMRCGSRYKQFA